MAVYDKNRRLLADVGGGGGGGADQLMILLLQELVFGTKMSDAYPAELISVADYQQLLQKIRGDHYKTINYLKDKVNQEHITPETDWKDYDTILRTVIADVLAFVEQKGYDLGYTTGFGEGRTAGYTEGYATGFAEGRTAGYSEGRTAGFAEGYTEGHTVGFTEGREAGYTEGRAAGFTEGYTVGYAAGYAAGQSGADPYSSPVDGWIDIRQVMANAPLLYDGSSNEYKAAAVTLLFDSKATTMFSQYSSTFGHGSAQAIWITSDGARYESANISGQVTHTWDESRDYQTCAQGYKTRYVITYLRNQPSSYITFDNYDYIWTQNNNALWIHMDNFEVRSVINYSTLTDSNYNMTPLEMITCGENARGTANTSFRFGIMKDLRHVELPEGMTKIGQQSFDMAYMISGFKSLKIPSTITEVGMLSMTSILPDKFVMPKNLATISSAQGMLAYYSVVGELIRAQGFSVVGGIKQLHFPVMPNTDLAMQVMNYGSVSSNAYSASLRAITCDSGFNIRYLVDFTRCIHLSKSAMVNYGNNIASRVGMTAGTITFGATNLAKLSAAEKLIFTQKNYTIN